MRISLGHIYSSTVSLCVHATNYTETEEIKMKHLDKVNEPYIQLQMTVIARKKKIQIKIFLKSCTKQKANVNSQG